MKQKINNTYKAFSYRYKLLLTCTIFGINIVLQCSGQSLTHKAAPHLFYSTLQVSWATYSLLPSVTY